MTDKTPETMEERYAKSEALAGKTHVKFKWRGQTMSGAIKSAAYYGERDGYYVEFNHDADSSRKLGSYDYVKSVCDGAHSFEFS